ncbi:MAG: ATP synthase F1 subunit gamma, partial [Verrucomicrobiota bacterium]|nr:ATP synthase F1 subunit gamma [Verrucomicrobiota bacterium]
MASVKDLRARIKSLRNTQQITKAMKQVAAAKIRRAELAQKQARPYADAMGEMLRDLTASVANVDHPFMKPGREGAPSGVILMTADKGLAGAFNSNMIRAAEQFRKAHPDVVFYTVGNKARNAVRRLGQSDRPSWALNAQPKIQIAEELAHKVTQDFVAGTIGDITLISAKMISMMVQRAETRRVIPVEAKDLSGEQKEETQTQKGSVEFSPSPEAVLSALLPKYLEFTLLSAMLETDASFYAAQLVAMNNATENAGKLIDELTIVMNNARQAAITKE